MTLTPDQLNAAFETCGAFFTWANAYRLFKDKEIKGIYWPTTIFFTLWGCFNLWFYPTINQMWSFYAGIILVSGNILWILQLAFYNFKRKVKHQWVDNELYCEVDVTTDTSWKSNHENKINQSAL